MAIGCVLEQHDGHNWLPLGFMSRHLKPSQQGWTTFRRELYALHQGCRYFHKEFGGKEPILFTDHRALIGSLQNPNLQTHDPIAHNQIIELGQWTTDIRYLQARSNPVSDFLSRPSPDTPTDQQVASLEENLKNQVTHEEIAKFQSNCPDTHNLRNGLHGKNVKFSDVNFGRFSLFCEVTNKPRPIIPSQLNTKIIKTFHCLDHAGKAETKRRTAENFYWLPDLAFSDQGNTFDCDLWKQFNEKLGVQVKFSPPYHQATNGQVKRMHLSIKNSLKAALIVADKHRERWMEFLLFVLLGRRNAVQPDSRCAIATDGPYVRR